MKKILIINANYYDQITNKLVHKAKLYLKNKGVKLSLIDVPGVYEIPIAINKYIKKFDGVVVIGCVIKGKTPHFNLICNATFKSILNLSLIHNKPIGNGIITALNKKQAYERCGIIKSIKPNKGYEAAKAVMSILQSGPKKI